MMKLAAFGKAMVAAACLVFMAEPVAAQAPQCFDRLLGQVCMTSGPTLPTPIYSSYGFVEMRAKPPASLTARLRNNYLRGRHSAFQRIFNTRTQAGVVTAEFWLKDGMVEKKIGSVIAASFSADNRTGVQVSENGTFTGGDAWFRVLQNFRLQPDRYALRVVFKIRYTNNRDSKIAAFVIGAVKLASPFLDPTGWLMTAANSDAITGKVNEFENRLFDENDTVETAGDYWLSIGNANTVTYRYGFEPDAPLDGFIEVRLGQRPSLFTQTVEAGLPKFGVNSFLQPDYNRFLGYPISETETFQQALERLVRADSWSAYRSTTTAAPAFDLACQTVKSATASSELGLNEHDAYALFWASWVASSNSSRDEVLGQACVANDDAARPAQGFGRYGLGVPKTYPRLAAVVATSTSGTGALTVPTPPTPRARLPIRGSEFTEFMDEWVFPAFSSAISTTSDRRERRRRLLAVIDPAVVFNAEVQIDEFEDLPPTAAADHYERLVDTLQGMSFRVGCFLKTTDPASDEKVRFFARRRAPDTDEILPGLWVYELSLKAYSRPLASTTKIVAITVRTAVPRDFEEAARVLVSNPSCGSSSTALTSALL